jgi:hypothetical protein
MIYEGSYRVMILGERNDPDRRAYLLQPDGVIVPLEEDGTATVKTVPAPRSVVAQGDFERRKTGKINTEIDDSLPRAA